MAGRRVLAGATAGALLLVIAGLVLALSTGKHPTKVLGNKTVRKTPPPAPSAIRASAISGGATVTWIPPSSSGNSPLTGFLVTTYPGGIITSAAPTATVAVISGLTNGVSYTFAVQALNAAGPSGLSGPSMSVTPTALTGPAPPNAASGPTGKGYWLVASDGGVFAFGDADRTLGSVTGNGLNGAIVGMAATPSGKGYWLVAADGGVFVRGNASYLNWRAASPGDPAHSYVGIVATPSGQGFWLVASDGGVFSYGDAEPNLGAMSDKPLNGSIVGIASR